MGNEAEGEVRGVAPGVRLAAGVCGGSGVRLAFGSPSGGERCAATDAWPSWLAGVCDREGTALCTALCEGVLAALAVLLAPASTL